MKKALILLYLIVAFQTFMIIVAFAVTYNFMRDCFQVSGRSIIEVCDQRYAPKVNS